MPQIDRGASAIAQCSVVPATANLHRRFLAGLVGNGIGGSRSPMLHETEADAQHIRLAYSLYDFAAMGLGATDLEAFLDSARRLSFAGLNITYPYKQAVMPFLDTLSEEARRIGAVNTIAFRDGVATGYNTDCLGFGESLARGLPDVAMNTVVQIGAGGAGAATAHALMEKGTGLLVLFDRDEQRVAALANNLGACYGGDRVRIGSDLVGALAAADGVVNTTPMGMAGHPGMPIPATALRPALWVADIVYFPLETELLRTARAYGCRTLDGSGMVVFQAAAAFEIFTGLVSDRERMVQAFRSRLESEAGASHQIPKASRC